MTTIEIARRLAELGQRQKAVEAYAIVIDSDAEPAEHLEAAAYLLDNGGDYKISYTTFIQLYNAGYFRQEILPLMTKIFYEPNIRRLSGRYERNRRLLLKYPYLFRKDFPQFKELPLSFFPYDDHNGYVPFDVEKGEFLGFVNTKEPVVSRNFFRDLEKPVLATDVFSQYELEYLKDTVRPSEWVARENHIYLHYTDWGQFCAWLQVLNMKPLLESKKVVFLIGDEIEQYPIDFKERFGIDYSKFAFRPVGISEINRMIWHTQLSTHNGGDFFNEIFDAHPNLLAMPSIMFYDIQNTMKDIREALGHAHSIAEAEQVFSKWAEPHVARELYQLRSPTDKDLLAAMYLSNKEWNQFVDWESRIAPALFFQQHFHDIVYDMRYTVKENAGGFADLSSDVLDQIHNLSTTASGNISNIFCATLVNITVTASTITTATHLLPLDPALLETEIYH